MSPMKKPRKPESEPEVHVHDVSKLKGELKAIGGSKSDDWNNMLANQTTRPLTFRAPLKTLTNQRRRSNRVLAGQFFLPNSSADNCLVEKRDNPLSHVEYNLVAFRPDLCDNDSKTSQ